MIVRRINSSIALATLLFVGCAVYLTNALELSFGSWRAPRAGFLPIIVGTIGTGLAAVNLVGTALVSEVEADIGDAPWRAALFAVALAAFVPALALMGYVPATFGILMALLKIHGARGWLLPLGVAAVTSVATWALFSHLLELRLP